MKKILGLDLGVSSVGWALITEDKEKVQSILGMGSRIIPLNTDDKDEFTSGNAISKNQKRTIKRTQRRGYDRYQLRRSNLKDVLKKNNMFPSIELMNLPPIELFGLRAKAVTEKIELQELGRVLYHLNQKRGYKSSRSDNNLDKKDTDYVAEVKNRYQTIKEAKQTIGQYFYSNLKSNQYYRTKQQVFPREAYIEEFETIVRKQQIFYPQITDALVEQIRDKIIYFQRNLKSQKGLVSICEFEGFYTKNKEGKEIFAGPKVTPRSSPLFQVCKIWESVNNITIKNRRGEIFLISAEKKRELFDFLDNNDKLSQKELFKILGINVDEGWYSSKQLAKGLPGNTTKSAIRNINKEIEHLLEFNISVIPTGEESFLIDKKTGEVLASTDKKIIEASFEKQPLYQLWHTIYSINDLEECSKALKQKFNLPSETADKLSVIDFTKAGFGNKSAKAIRKILPYLMEGFLYSDACSFAGYNHSNSLIQEEKLRQPLKESLPNLPKNSLRQPIVEKILNQVINVVNAIIATYGKPDEIRIELARELKQSKEERNGTAIAIAANERIHEEITKRLDELGIRATRKNIEKYKFLFPIRTVYKKDGAFDKKSFDNAQVNNQCIYCGERFNLSDALNGDNFDVDHIIPRSLLFDDSQTNKVLVHRKCNADDKKNKTAFDFMRAKGEDALNRYLERLDDWYKKGILSYSKLERLKASHEDYLLRKAKKKETEADKKLWENFIERQLRESQYIARKAKEILEQICYNVWSTSGSVTDYLRKNWGWNEVLMNLQLSKYREAGLTEWKETEKADGKLHKVEVIKDWTKRKDHRHHAIDALIIACTRQGFIQRINTLNASDTRDKMRKEIEESAIEFNKRKNLLNNYLESVKPFTTKQVEEAVSKILISFKAGKKVATIGKRKVKSEGKKKVAQTGIVIPRGALSEESVYGKILSIEKEKPVKYLFENPHLIFKTYIKELVEKRLAQHNNDVKKALTSIKKDPLYLDEQKTKELKYGTCYKEEVVIKYSIESLKAKDADYIVDEKVKAIVKSRLEKYNGKEKEAFKDVLWFNEEKKIPIRTVRCFTGLSAVEAVKKDEQGNEIGFVKPGNNHHIAIYTDEEGKKQEHVVTFWNAVERKKYGIPVVITNPKELWDSLQEKELPEAFLTSLPQYNWNFDVSLQQNEMFVLGLSNEEWNDAIRKEDFTVISRFLYRVQKISPSYYVFRHHLETEIDDTQGSKKMNRYYLVQSFNTLEKLTPKKIIIDILGKPAFN